MAVNAAPLAQFCSTEEVGQVQWSVSVQPGTVVTCCCRAAIVESSLRPKPAVHVSVNICSLLGKWVGGHINSTLKAGRSCKCNSYHFNWQYILRQKLEYAAGANITGHAEHFTDGFIPYPWQTDDWVALALPLYT